MPLFLLFSAPTAHARSDGGAPLGAAVAPPTELVPARGIEAAVDVKGLDASMRFGLPVKVPAWFLWQQATDCAAYLRAIKEVKRCEYFVQDGKPAVLLVAEILGRQYPVVVGIERHFRRGKGRIKFESRNLVPTQATGALDVEPTGEGESRLSFEATFPRDASVPELLWRMGVAAVVHASAAQIQVALEREYAAVKQNRALRPQVQLRSRGTVASPADAPRPPAPPPAPTAPSDSRRAP